jgi:UbiD family decarboxylase
VAHLSLESFIDAADEMGEVTRVEGADRDTDIGCLVELAFEMQGPMLVFDNVSGFSPGFRLAANVLKTPSRFALAMGLPTDSHPVDLVRLFRDRRRGVQGAVQPRVVSDGPVLTCMREGADVDLNIFPAPRWHDSDGGHYLGTGDLVVTQDPDSPWVNVGVYRGQVQSRDRLSLWINPMKHGRILAEKYWRRRKAAPVAVVLGCDPLTWICGSTAAPAGVSEYDYAGAMRCEPLDVVRLPLTSLPVPAHAEIVLEGEIPSPDEESAFEGPFGEWPGYYSHQGQECVVRVKRVYHRPRPIVYGAAPLRPIGRFSGTNAIPPFTAEMWEHLERSGVTDVAGVWGFCNTLMLVVSLRQRYAGHAKQALLSLASFRSSASMYRYYVAVDADIDPSNLDEVVWALCTRVDPAESVDIVRGAWTSDLDPRVPPDKRERGDLTVGRLLIDACRPFAWRDAFPQPNVFGPEARQRITERWGDLLQEFQRKQSRASQAPWTGGVVG